MSFTRNIFLPIRSNKLRERFLVLSREKMIHYFKLGSGIKISLIFVQLIAMRIGDWWLIFMNVLHLEIDNLCNSLVEEDFYKKNLNMQ